MNDVLALTAHWQGHLHAAIILFILAIVFLGIGYIFQKSSDEAGCFVFFLALVALIATCVQVFGIFSAK
jgi:hypothetical protein